MAQRVFVKVVGFSDVERHALNTVFRLSEQRETVYSLWMADAPEPAHLRLIDGQSYEASVEVEAPGVAATKMIWVGAVAPAAAWRTFQRPISWPEVVRAMDQLFAPPEPLDFDLGFGDSEVVESELPAGDGQPAKRALIASGSREERLYLRARLALAHLTQADDAETAAQVRDLIRDHQYAVALVDFGLAEGEGWAFVKELAAARPAIGSLIVNKKDASLIERARGHFAGTDGFFDKPPHPGKLNRLLRKV